MKRLAESIVVPVSREELWPLIAHTDRLNREVGLPSPDFAFTARSESGAVAVAKVRVGPMRLEYEESPFEWSRPDWYRVRRVFRSGPIRQVVGGAELHDEPGGVRVVAFADYDAAPGTGALVTAKLRSSIRDVLAAAGRFAESITDSERAAYPNQRSAVVVDQNLLSDRLRQTNAPYAEPLRRWIETATDPQVAEFRPCQFAAFAGTSLDVTPTLLAATRAGILDLEWRVMCPFCQSNRRLVRNLRDLDRAAHCDVCDIRFDARFDENVEVVFSVHPAIRNVERRSFCVGGPELTPQGLAQYVVPAGGEIAWTIPWAAGRLRRIRRFDGSSVEIDIEENASSEWSCDVSDTTPIRVAPGATVIVRNPTDRPEVVRFDDLEREIRATTAAHVTTLPQFRDQFSSQALAPGHEMAVRSVCVMFTDLKGSTRMYELQGDAESYAYVRERFAALTEAIEARGGAIVKTIGDAVMAVFRSLDDGVHAALDYQRSAAGHVATRIGLHSGPAIVVNANDRLDYFGRTVNLAARLQKYGDGGDVVVTEAGLQECRIDDGVEIEAFDAQPPGFERSIRLARIRPAGTQ